MTEVVLAIGKLALLALLYLFLWRVVRVIAADLRDPVARPSAATPRPAVAAPERRPAARRVPTELVVHAPNVAPRTVALTGDRLVFGRADHVDQVLGDEYVSDEHAELVRVEDEWRVRDLGSTNGTLLNDQQVIAPTAVAAGDQLQLGRTRIEVRR